MFGEEDLLKAVADYILSKSGNTVSNLSFYIERCTEVTGKYEEAVGEVNVVTKMKDTEAIIGGEGMRNHLSNFALWKRLTGRIALLTHLEKKMKCSKFKATYPGYFMPKNKFSTPSIDVDSLLKQMEEKQVHEQVNNIDGLKIDFNEEWIIYENPIQNQLLEFIQKVKLLNKQTL